MGTGVGVVSVAVGEFGTSVGVVVVEVGAGVCDGSKG
jgi:hypothetical protein